MNLDNLTKMIGSIVASVVFMSIPILCVCSLCAVTETATHFIHHIEDKFCRGCGAVMDEKDEGVAG